MTRLSWTPSATVSTGLLFEVVRARLATGGEVAIKKPVPAHAQSKRARALLEREAKACADMAGVHAPFLLGMNVEAGEILRAWVPGQTLADLRAAKGAASVQFALALFVSLLEALEHIHQRGWLVVDLSPSNVLLGPTGALTILDFGSARQRSDADSKSRSDGDLDPVAPGFAAPEHLAGLPLGVYSDVYAAAKLMQWMVTGESAREGAPSGAQDDLSDMMQTALKRGGAAALTPTLRSCLTQAETSRPSDTGALRTRCRAHLRAVGVLDVSSLLADVDQAWTRASARSRRWLLAVGCAVALLAGVGFWLHRAPNQAAAQSGGGWLDVSASPWAECAVDGAIVGTTPLGAPWPLAAGSHVVRCTHPEAAPEVRTVSVNPGQRAHVFVPMRVAGDDPSSPEGLAQSYAKEPRP